MMIFFMHSFVPYTPEERAAINLARSKPEEMIEWGDLCEEKVREEYKELFPGRADSLKNLLIFNQQIRELMLSYKRLDMTLLWDRSYKK